MLSQDTQTTIQTFADIVYKHDHEYAYQTYTQHAQVRLTRLIHYYT